MIALVLLLVLLPAALTFVVTRRDAADSRDGRDWRSAGSAVRQPE